MRELIQVVIEKMIADGYITVNPHLRKEVLGAMISEAMREIKVIDFLKAFNLE